MLLFTSMNAWIIIWLVFWLSVMGLPIYVFKKHKITLYEKSWQHTLFYIFSLIMLFIVYHDPFSIYFNNLPRYSILVIFVLFLLWLLVPVTYQNDYYTKKERLGYQVPKFFEIIFQQLCFLGGLLTFGVSPIVFGLIFFAVHTPFIFFVHKNFAFFVTGSSLVGGLVFAYLQSQGVLGFLIALFLHLLFWCAFHYTLSNKNFLGVTPLKR